MSCRQWSDLIVWKTGSQSQLYTPIINHTVALETASYEYPLRSMWFMYTFVPCRPRFCTSTGLVSKSLGCLRFWGTCTNVCPRTDVLELVQPVLDQLARPAAEPLSWGPSWKISAEPRTETVPEWKGKSAWIPLYSVKSTVCCLKQSHGRCPRLWSRGHYDQVGPNLSEADYFRIF